jgi:DNA-binding beta-propeller fold protein YncE
LSYPYDIAVDAHGNQFVCEFGNSRIQVFDANCQPVEIIGGPGAEPGRFANPWGVALDSHGNLFVADALNHRLQKLVRKMGPVGLRRPMRGMAQNDGSRNTQHATR